MLLWAGIYDAVIKKVKDFGGVMAEVVGQDEIGKSQVAAAVAAATSLLPEAVASAIFSYVMSKEAELGVAGLEELSSVISEGLKVFAFASTQETSPLSAQNTLASDGGSAAAGGGDEGSDSASSADSSKSYDWDSPDAWSNTNTPKAWAAWNNAFGNKPTIKIGDVQYNSRAVFDDIQYAHVKFKDSPRFVGVAAAAGDLAASHFKPVIISGKVLAFGKHDVSDIIYAHTHQDFSHDNKHFKQMSVEEFKKLLKDADDSMKAAAEKGKDPKDVTAADCKAIDALSKEIYRIQAHNKGIDVEKIEKNIEEIKKLETAPTAKTLSPAEARDAAAFINGLSHFQSDFRQTYYFMDLNKNYDAPNPKPENFVNPAVLKQTILPAPGPAMSVEQMNAMLRSGAVAPTLSPTPAASSKQEEVERLEAASKTGIAAPLSGEQMNALLASGHVATSDPALSGTAIDPINALLKKWSAAPPVKSVAALKVDAAKAVTADKTPTPPVTDKKTNVASAPAPAVAA